MLLSVLLITQSQNAIAKTSLKKLAPAWLCWDTGVSPCLPLHSLACGYLVFPTWSVDKILFLHVRLALVLNVSGSARCDNTCNLVPHSVGKRGQPSWLYLHRLILSTLFYSIVGWSDFMILPYCFDYHSFVILFEIKKSDISNFVLCQIFSECLGYFWGFVWILVFVGLFVMRCHCNFYRDCIGSFVTLHSIT